MLDTNTTLADQWAGDLRLPLAIIRRHADALRGADGALTDAQIQSVLMIEEQTEQLGLLLGTLESIEAPASVAALQSSGAGGRTPPAILIADDDDLILEALGDLLSDRYRLTLARDGREAMLALCLCSFDLAIIDLRLPVVDGWLIPDQLRALALGGTQALPTPYPHTEHKLSGHTL